MKRISIDNRSLGLIEDEDIRPSLLRKLKESVISNSIYRIEDLCEKTEDELLSIDGFDAQILCIIKTKLQDSGLSLGMTPEELLQYEDAEYDRLHPEENVPQNSDSFDDGIPIVGSKEWLADVIKNPDKYIHGFHLDQDQREDSKKVPLTIELKRRLMYQHENKVRRDLNEKLGVRANVRMIADDIEFMKMHLFRTFFAEQPWYIRLFKTREERFALAKDEAENMTMGYVRNLIEEIVKVRQQSFSKELDECWDKNWFNYLEDLKR